MSKCFRRHHGQVRRRHQVVPEAGGGRGGALPGGQGEVLRDAGGERESSKPKIFYANLGLRCKSLRTSKGFGRFFVKMVRQTSVDFLL